MRYCGVPLTELAPGDVIEENGRWVTVKSVQPREHDDELWVLATSGKGVAARPGTIFKLYRPELLNEIRADIARIYAGATLAE
jgi:hypothetical protein